MRNKIDNAEVWKDNQRVNFLDKMITEDKYKSSLVKQHKELEYLEESIGYHSTFVEACKAYFISKINGLQKEIDIAIVERKEINHDNCKQLMCLRNFIKEVYNSSDKIQEIYGYNRYHYIPILVHPHRKFIDKK